MYQIAARSSNCYHRDTGEVQPEAGNLPPSGWAGEGFLEKILEPDYWAETHEEVILV